ncbi:MAG: cardiolipin synthase [Deltaproteobacteria bacterium]|nr:cardiolipin synthase [Deltaproteobacteria bacterium]
MHDVTLTTTLISIAHWAIVVTLSIRVIMRRLPVGVSLAWLAVIYGVPFVGAFAYLLIGENRLSKEYLKRTANIHGVYSEWQRDLQSRTSPARSIIDRRVASLQYHAETVVGFPPMQGNQLQLMDDFKSVFDSIITDLNRARRTCHLEFYIWHMGGMADQVGEALVRAVKRGVICRVLMDAIGSKKFLKSRFARELRDSGVQLATSLPVGLSRVLTTRADLRNHRKIIVIDGEIAYTGSQNLVDPRYFKQDEGVGQWIDAMVRMEGPSVEALAGIFMEGWELDTGEGLAVLEATSDVKPVPAKGPSAVQVVPSGPGFRPEAIHQLLLTTIYCARKELVITTPYFVPDDTIHTALISAAHRGVEVILVVPSNVDSRLAHYASRSLYDDLLSAGVRIAGFRGGLLHTKSITVDREFSVFGSVNLDMRSLWLDFEISLFVYDPDFTERVRAMQARYMEDTEILDLAEWRSRPAIQRFVENAAHLVGPLL